MRALVGATGEAADIEMIVLAQLLGQVVVAVDQRRALEDAVDPLGDGGGDRLGGSGRSEERGGGESEDGAHGPTLRARNERSNAGA